MLPFDLAAIAILTQFHGIQRLLVVSGGGNHLPGAIGNEAIVAFLVNDFWNSRDVAANRPAKRSGKATVQNNQAVAAGQLGERFLHLRHGEVSLGIS